MVDIISASPAGIGSSIQAATGAFLASANAASLVCGFNPKSVLVINETQNIIYRKLQGSSPNTCVKTIGAGTQTMDTTGIITFPADVGLNEPGSTVLIAAGTFNVGDKIAWIVEG